MPVLLQIPENPNCEPMDGQVFQCRTAPRVVSHAFCECEGAMAWCPITGIDEQGKPCDATACIVEDSGEGACYLVVGGEWGLRVKPPDAPDAWDTDKWDLANARQWGVPYLLLGGEGADLRFTG